MAKKKKDPYEEAKDEGTRLEDFIIQPRIRAFINAYKPCEESVASDTFDETKLRNFFKAWPTSLGDPLSIYLEELESSGYFLKVGRTGELAIFVMQESSGKSLLSDSL